MTTSAFMVCSLLLSALHVSCVSPRIAYQSALLTGPLLLLRIIAALLQFPSVLCTFLTLVLVTSCLYMVYVHHNRHTRCSADAVCPSWRAYIDAAKNGLVRFQLPWIGPMAEQWVAEE